MNPIARWLLDRFVNFYYKIEIAGIAYAMAFLCGGATVVLRNFAPFSPVSYYTLVWIIAFLFPATASLYSMFNLRVRLNEIEDASQRSSLHFVYFPARREESERDFRRFLRLRFDEYYNMWELAAFSLIAGTVAFVGLSYLLLQFLPPVPSVLPGAIKPPPDPIKLLVIREIPRWVLVAGSGFLGALTGAFVLIYKRYRTFDIYPSTYLQVTVGLIVGTLAGVFLVTIWPATYTTFLAFATAFLIAININFLPRLLRSRFAAMTGVELPQDIPTDLHEVIRNSEAIEGLNNMSLVSVAELVKVELIQLYLNIPQSLGVINGWMDEGLLHYYYLPAQRDALRQVNIQRFTQLLQLLVDQWVPGVGVRWRENPRITGDAATDQVIFTTMTNLIASRLHHRQLGFLSENYRRAYFIPVGE